MSSQFKNASGAYLTQAMFFETTLGDKSQVVYTLKEQDHLGYPSLYRLYMEADDLTEYDFALAHLGGWSHWERLTKAPFFKPYVAAWRKELELRARSRALRRIQKRAEADTKDSLQADKILLGGHWKPTQTSRRGAPSKQEIKDAADRLATTDKSIEDDFNRITQLQ